MKKELNTNNSKKIIIGISILFCTVILIIGVTTAYFTQSGIGETGNVVSTDQVTIDYNDNDDYMLGELIPINENDLETAYNNKCKDEKGYNVCSIYQFTITNTGNVVQDIIIDMYPKINGFTNLKFNLYDITSNEQIIFNQELILNSEEPINLVNDLTLDTGDNKSNIYELVFYINNDPNNDQTILDAGKRFGANIKVNSVTTGKYLIEDLGDDGCWEIRDIVEDETVVGKKLFAFNGINNIYKLDENGDVIYDKDYGEIDTACSRYIGKDGDSYWIKVPSTVAGEEVTTIGNELFQALDLNTMLSNNYHKINNIYIEEGIITIEDSNLETSSIPFAGVGVDIEFTENGPIFNNIYDVTVSFPSTITDLSKYGFYYSGNINSEFRQVNNITELKVIDDYAFAISMVNNISLPDGITTIGEGAFSTTQLTSITIPSSVTEIKNSAFEDSRALEKVTFENTKDKISQLYSIGENAFKTCNLNYTATSLIIPPNVQEIGKDAFYVESVVESSLSNPNLDKIEYKGTSESILNNTTEWYKPNYTQLNPQG